MESFKKNSDSLSGKHIVFIAPRFHSNQRDLVKKILCEKWSASFLVAYASKSEDHSDLRPIIVKPSLLSSLVVNGNLRYVDPGRWAEKYVPSIRELWQSIYRLKPDIAIIRGMTSWLVLLSLPLLIAMRVKIVLYTQGPKYREKVRISQRFVAFFVFDLLKGSWITPCERRVTEQATKPVDPRIDFIPFFKYPTVDGVANGSEGTRFLAVGKYEKRKNHAIAIEAFAEVADETSRLTIIGEKSRKSHEREFDRLASLIKAHGLEKKVSLLANISLQQVCEEMKRNDVFLMLSEKELASYAHIEAMSCGMAVVCSTDNGTAHYVDESCGVLCEPTTFSAVQAMRRYVEDKSLSDMHGQGAYRKICSDFSVDELWSRFRASITK